MGCTVNKATISAFAKAGSKQEYIENTPHLSDAQKLAVKDNWQVLKLHIANIGVMTYISMFESRPELIEVFSNFKGKDLSELQNSGLLGQHALRVMATIDKCITRIDEPSSMIYLLREVGHHHKQYNVQPDDIQIILPHFLSAIKPHIKDSWCTELHEAWAAFLTLMVHHIGEGMQSGSEPAKYKNEALTV